MADITGTAVGVISLAITVFGGLINFYSAWKDQDSNIRTTYLQLENLTATLQQLQLALAKQDTDSAAAAQVNRCLEACRAGIDRLSRKLDKIRQNGPPRHGQLSSLVRSATYPFKESTLMKLRETVSELREQLNLAVNVLEA
jgi:hypothetical protein